MPPCSIFCSIDFSFSDIACRARLAFSFAAASFSSFARSAAFSFSVFACASITAFISASDCFFSRAFSASAFA